MFIAFSLLIMVVIIIFVFYNSKKSDELVKANTEIKRAGIRSDETLKRSLMKEYRLEFGELGEKMLLFFDSINHPKTIPEEDRYSDKYDDEDFGIPIPDWVFDENREIDDSWDDLQKEIKGADILTLIKKLKEFDFIDISIHDKQVFAVLSEGVTSENIRIHYAKLTQKANYFIDNHNLRWEGV